jgi:hypothetical protein
MKSRFAARLRRELRSAGAGEAETDRLLAVAAGLGELPATGQRHRPRPRPAGWRLALPTGLALVAVLFAGGLLVAASQTSLPGSWLYPVQKLSDNAAESAHPQYRAVVMMKRAQEVKQLVAKRADSGAVLAALNDYQAEAAAYKAGAGNYSAFEYCKTNLQQAAQAAPSPERAAITTALSALNNV